MSNFDTDFLKGMLCSIESDNGYTEETVNQAVLDWSDFYEGNLKNPFTVNLLVLILQAVDKNDLFRISRGFPSHVKVFCETLIDNIEGANNG